MPASCLWALPEDRLREAEERMEAGRIRALIIEDNQDITANLYAFLEPLGYELDCSANGHIGLEMAVAGTFDVIVLDIMLPDEDGLTILKKLRDAGPTKRLPVIMLTAKDQEQDELLGFELGVDEYISKPFSPKILVARVEALLRRTVQTEGEQLEAGGIVMDVGGHHVSIDGKGINLSYKEFELLQYFMSNQGRALTRESILNQVWNYDYFGDARTIDTHVKKLRSKLGEKGSYIHTIWGMGYKFEVEEN